MEKSQSACLVQIAHEEDALEGFHTQWRQSANPIVCLKVEHRGHWVHHSLQGIVEHLQHSLSSRVIQGPLHQPSCVSICNAEHFWCGCTALGVLSQLQLNAGADGRKPARKWASYIVLCTTPL